MLRCMALLVPTALLVSLVSGCGPSQSDIEKSIRDDMKKSKGVTITSLDLKKQSDGGYVGTAQSQNGDDYEITCAPPKGQQVEWKAMPGPKMVDKEVRAAIEAKSPGSKVKSLHLSRGAEAGTYSGDAELDNGMQLTVTTHMQGMDLQMNWAPK